jgi:hypothetical protein
MKKMIIAIIIIITFINVKTLNCINSDNKNNYYPLVATVIEINDDTVMIEDNNGEVWEFESAEDWQINDICSCIMNDNGTQKIYDDEIVKIKFDGVNKEK